MVDGCKLMSGIHNISALLTGRVIIYNPDRKGSGMGCYMDSYIYLSNDKQLL